MLTIARYWLRSPQLPPITGALPLAERVRATLMGIYKRLKLRELYGPAVPVAKDLPSGVPPPRSPVFSGKDADGRPLEGHGHAFYLPADEDGDGRIDHLTVVAEMGLGEGDPLEVTALDELRRVRWGQDQVVQLLLVGLGRADDFRSPLFGPSRTWVSASPFLVTRHAKRNGRKRDPAELLGQENRAAFTAHVLGEELDRLRRHRGAPTGTGPTLPGRWQIEPLTGSHGEFLIPPRRDGTMPDSPSVAALQFHRQRQKQHDQGARRPCGSFRIRFAEPVHGPLCLGLHAHFGMGLFLPERSVS